TGVPVKDCFKEEDTIYIVVPPGNLGKAVGKNGIVIKKIQHNLRKNIRVIEYRDNVADFVGNIIYPIQVERIIEEENAVIIKDSNRSVKSQIIGREGKNLNIIKRAVQRFFPTKEVRVE
ncbi:NusA-like transcription termination signal-binding factor, partial [Candidatus Woesearchaeota archaeon]|nr:NusA-like transcription termination signal-binding factor [Candidatus Woesearchaeota archaeon]